MNQTKKTAAFILFSTFLVLKSFAQETYKAALDEYDKDNYQKAVELFTQAIDKKENLADSYKLRGSSYLWLQKYDEAKKDLDMALKLDKDLINLMLFYGKYYLAINENKTAIEYLDKAILKDPKDDEYYSLRGGAKARLGDYEGAMKDGDKSVEINPDEEQNYTNRGFTKLLMKQYEEAIKDFDAGIKFNPTQKGYANKGYAYALMDMQSFAILYYNKSLDMQPDDPITLYYRGCSYEVLGKYEEACGDFVQAKTLTGDASFLSDVQKSMERIKCIQVKD